MLIDRLNSLKNLTYQEKNVLKYINENPDALLHLSAVELAEKSYTSTATITRFVQKAGLNGFAEMKTVYSLQYSEMINRKNLLEKEPFSSFSSIDDIFHRLPAIYSKNIEYYRSVLNRDDLKYIVSRIKKYHCIEFYASGSSYHISQIMMQQFESMGYECHVYDYMQQEHFQNMLSKQVNIVAFLLSFSGENPFIVSVAKSLAQFPCYNTVAVSADINKDLENLCTTLIPLSFIESEKEMRTSIYINSILFIFDIIFTCLQTK